MPDAPRDPDTIRDTVPIRPLRRWVSRLLVTAALLAAAALGVFAAREMGEMATDPNVRERFEAVERMRLGAAATDSTGIDSTATDSTDLPADSAGLPEAILPD
jgi:hypothetical protein